MAESSGPVSVTTALRLARKHEKALYDPDDGLVQEIRRQGKRIDTIFAMALATTLTAVVGVATIVLDTLRIVH